MRMHNPPHPGHVIREYLGDMSVSAAADHLGVGRVTLSRVLNGKAAVSPEMAVRLARAFGPPHRRSGSACRLSTISGKCRSTTPSR
jgi:addiction module HigA family antidote